MFQTLWYKGHVIYILTYKYQQLIEVLLLGIRYKVKSYRAAQYMITKHINKLKRS